MYLLSQTGRDRGSEMRVIIAGSRDITDYTLVVDAVEKSGWGEDIETVVSGGAKGVDLLGERWAKENIGEDNIDVFLADWGELGNEAGFARNYDMAMNADALIAVWDKKSNGTRHMINIANEMGLEVSILKVK